MSEPVKFRGIVLFERFYNDNTFWGVYNVKTKDNIPYAKKQSPSNVFEDDDDFETYYAICVKGKMQRLYVGSEYEFNATYEYDVKFKEWEYVPKTVTAIAPASGADSKLFLSSLTTEAQAETLLDVYPNIVQEIIDGKDNVDLKKLHGIGSATYEKIRNKIIDNYVISDIIMLLQPYGVTYTAIKNLLKWEPQSAILKQKITENPYCLTHAKGFGFITVDKIALKMDPSLINSGNRLIAYLKYYLGSVAENDGDTYVSTQKLRASVIEQIPQCLELFDKLISLNENGEFGGFFYFEDGKIGLSRYHDCENSIYDILIELDNYAYQYDIDTDGGISIAEKELGYKLSEEQKAVVEQIKNNNVIIFAGAAGTGKSSTARAILNSFKNADIACCSLSAKAAQRIQEATGFKAMTIHRLLEYDTSSFRRNAENRLTQDVIFLDEASMVNCTLFYCLVSAIKEGAKLIVCGDYAQLPPIGAGAIFADLLNMKDIFNISVLTKVHRQAEASGILMDANKVREGIFPIDEPKQLIVNGELKDMAYIFRESKERIQDIIVNQFIKIKDKYGLGSVVAAIPRKDTVINSALEINKQIQSRIINVDNVSFIEGMQNKFYIGDRIIQIENDGKRDIYNGEVGFVTDVFPDAKAYETVLIAQFKSTLIGQDKIIEYNREQLKTILLGYALSVHRLQGSEYEYVIVALDTTHYTLLDRCMLYTAITRAKKMCILVSQPIAFSTAMKQNKVNRRQTWLSLKYEGEMSG